MEYRLDLYPKLSCPSCGGSEFTDRNVKDSERTLADDVTDKMFVRELKAHGLI